MTEKDWRGFWLFTGLVALGFLVPAVALRRLDCLVLAIYFAICSGSMASGNETIQLPGSILLFGAVVAIPMAFSAEAPAEALLVLVGAGVLMLGFSAAARLGSGAPMFPGAWVSLAVIVASGAVALYFYTRPAPAFRLPPQFVPAERPM